MEVRDMFYQQTQNDYTSYERKETSAQTRRCIDGTITGCNKCIAYCKYEGHPGFLTEDLKKKHDCEEKNCMYYLPKPQNMNRLQKKNKDNENNRIMSVAKAATANFEGLRLMRASKVINGGWIIYYVTIAGYAFDLVALEIEESIGEKVEFSKLDYSFEISANLIFEMKVSA